MLTHHTIHVGLTGRETTMETPNTRHARADLDHTPRYAPDRVWVTRNGQAGELPVIAWRFHPPTVRPPQCPIAEGWGVVELVTKLGSRWYGCARAYISAELRMVVIGTPKRDEVRMRWAIVPEDQR